MNPGRVLNQPPLAPAKAEDPAASYGTLVLPMMQIYRVRPGTAASLAVAHCDRALHLNEAFGRLYQSA